jgi:hypothetical protein
MFQIITMISFLQIRNWVIRIIRETAIIYLFWITLHWLSSILYVKYCTVNTLYGFLMTPFMTTMHHCVAIRWTIYHSGQMIQVMWTLLGKWAIEQLIFYKWFEYKDHL